MRHDTIDAELRNRRMRRIWYGHGSSRLITDDSRNRTPANVIDEAISHFAPIDTRATSNANFRTDDNHPLPASLIDKLTAQLATLDRQREQLANLLRHVDGIAAEK
jgi:hypothetical protein